MKFMKLCAFSAITLMASFAFADANNYVICFSTVGIDRYADGEPVRDGERYALVWTPNETFGGFNADGTAVSPDDRVICVAKLAKDGRCGATLFNVDSALAAQLTGGKYCVYMLDTRVSKTSLSPKLEVSGTVAVTDYTVGGARSAAVGEYDISDTADAVRTSSAAIGGDTTAINPVIDAVEVEDANVVIRVSNLRPGLSYSLKGGLDRATGIDAEIDASETTATIVVDKDAAQFFSIKAE